MRQSSNITEPVAPIARSGPGAGRPFSARSVIASTLLGVRPPRLPSRQLVRAGMLFGIAEGTVRVALSRMVAAGELVSDDGRYELSGRLLERQERQHESRHAPVGRWNGRWDLQVVEPGRRTASERVELRTAMGALRYGEWREGVWLRPDNLDPARLTEMRSVVAGQCRSFDGRPDQEPSTLSAELWDLDGWSIGADRLAEEMATSFLDLESGRADVLADAFVLSAAVLRHLLADPLLPAGLLPVGWSGPRLRDDYERFDAAFKERWRGELSGAG